MAAISGKTEEKLDIFLISFIVVLRCKTIPFRDFLPAGNGLEKKQRQA